MDGILEELSKARKAKGLANWKKLESLSEQLQGKQASHITFTTCYPGQEGSKKYLGSSSGNLHFLLGYVNPGFAVAAYHWKIVDPNMTDEEAKSKKHPANPRYWKESGLVMELEGDLDDGKPHPAATKGAMGKARAAQKKSDTKTVKSGYGTYVAVPQDGLVWSMTNGHVYRWNTVRESYFAATNPELDEVMQDDEAIEEQAEKSVLAMLRGNLQPFDRDVYPLLKSLLPKPGAVFPVDDKFAVVHPNRITFHDKQGELTSIKVYDRVYKAFDILEDGDIHPSILVNFVVKALNVPLDELQQFVHDEDELPRFAKGLPTPGFEDPELVVSYPREVIVDHDDVLRVVPKEAQ